MGFLPAFRDAFNESISIENIQGGFRGAGLVPFNPEAVLEKLDVRLQTPSPRPPEDAPWQPKTPSNSAEFGSQSKLIRNNFHSSPASIKEGFSAFRPTLGLR